MYQVYQVILALDWCSYPSRMHTFAISRTMKSGNHSNLAQVLHRKHLISLYLPVFCCQTENIKWKKYQLLRNKESVWHLKKSYLNQRSLFSHLELIIQVGIGQIWVFTLNDIVYCLFGRLNYFSSNYIIVWISFLLQIDHYFGQNSSLIFSIVLIDSGTYNKILFSPLVFCRK